MMRAPHAVQFLGAQALGQAADAMTTLVVAEVVLSGGSGAVEPARLLTTLGAAALPYLVLSPLSGIVADRWDRRRMLFVVNCGRALVTLEALVAVAVGSHLAGMAAMVGLLAGARLVYNLRLAGLPHTIGVEGARPPIDRLVALDAAALRVGAVALAVGGAIGAVAGGRAPIIVLALAAVLQVHSGVAFLALRCDLGGRSGARARGDGLGLRGVTARCGRLLASGPSRTAIVVTSTHRVLLGATFATFVLVAANECGFGARGYVVASGVTGVGSLLGTLTAPAMFAATGGAAPLVRAAFALPAALLGLTALVGSQVYLVVAVAAAFFLFQNVRVVADAHVQAAIPDDARARIFSAYDALYNLSYFGGAAVAVAATETARPGVLAWAGLGYLVLAAGFSVPGALRALPPGAVDAASISRPRFARPRLVRSAP